MRNLLSIAALSLIVGTTLAQTPPTATHPPRPTPPTRDPHTPGYVTAKELPDGTNAPANADGNFILGPTHNPAPEMSAAARRTAGNRHRVHHELHRQQALSRHRPRAQHLRHARSHRSRQA